MKNIPLRFNAFLRLCLLPLLCHASLQAQTLLNIDFGVGTHSTKSGFAATGQATNDFWNLYRHYEPKFLPGTKLVHNGELKNLKLADGTDTKIVVTVTNAPGVWGNASGDPMFDTFIFAQNGSNITVAIHGLDPGRYHLYLYGHADPDVTGEQNSIFNLRSGTNELGPLATTGVNGWKASAPWQERHQYVVFRDVPVVASQPLFIDVAPGPNGIAVVNGLQLISRGTSPPRLVTTPTPKTPSALTNLLVHEVRYTGKVSDSEARFEVTLDIESLTTNEISRALFDGDVAVLANEIPAGLRIVSSAKQYRLICSTPGRYALKLELVAKITKAEPWNQIRFNGPVAAIASVSASAASSGVEMQLLSGTQLNPDTKSTSRVEGFLGSERELALRWQSKTTEIARKSLVTVDTVATAQITPTVIKFSTQLRYNILQAPVAKLTLQIPTGHTLTKVQGEQIRDWSVKTEVERQLLTIEFVKPVEKSYALTLLSEQLVEGSPATAQLVAPQPLDVERESGSFTLSAEDMVAEIDSTAGLRQVNAAADTLAAYRFYGRPFNLNAKLRRIEPVLKVADRVGVRLEETRLLVNHALTLNVEKSGIYAIELTPQAGFVVAEVRGEGVEDWKTTDGKLRVSFAAKVLGSRRLDVQLEQALKTFPDQIALAPLRVTGATNETAQIGASSAPGIRLKTAGELAGLREVPVTTLSPRGDESLAYTADAGNWGLALGAERLPARVVADVFNLVTIGDGLVGGSAVVRYGILNQGVQEFRVKLPAHWKNVEFTGPNIRRKETNATPAELASDTNSVFWTIALQDKAWGGYTLVITYDYQFDAKKASLNLAGAHALGVERETGSVALTTAGSLQLKPQPIAEPLRLIDQTELAETDRALITRPVLLAYRYTGERFALNADVVRNQEVQDLLNAVADRTQITSVLTDEGQMLSQASFMVKNNDKQFQKFRLPAGASLWGCYVNNQPVKAEQDGEWLLVSLPRDANRDQAFAVDIVYKQTLASVNAGVIPKSLELAAPQTDVPNTYAEWQLYVPTSQRLSSFGGSMTVQRGTTYDLRDAWKRFTSYYGEVFRDYGAGIIVFGGGGLFLIALIGAAVRSGKSGAVAVLVTFVILALLAGMMLPALSKAKSKAQRISSVNSLKQIALAARMFANDNGEQLPASFDDMKLTLGSDKVLIDPATGERFVYVGAGKKTDNPQAIIAYSPVDIGGRNVAFADGSVQQMSSAQFAEALQRDAELGRQVRAVTVAGDQLDALARQQVQAGAPVVAYSTAVLGQTPARPASEPMDSKNGFMLGAVTGLGGTASPATASPVPQRPPTSTGIRSIRIDIPRTGQMFSFTKVLNMSDEALSVKMSVMKLKAFQVIRSVCQLAFFLSGLFIVWREWTRVPRRTFRLTVGTAFVIGAVCALGLSLRALHLWFIAGTPLALGIAFVWALVKFWPRSSKRASENESASESTLPPEPTGPATVPPAVASIALLLTLVLGFTANARAQEESPITHHESRLTNTVSIVSATYTGTVREKVAQFDATLVLSSIATNQTIALFGADVAVQEFKTDAREAKLVRQGKDVAVRLADKGTVTLRLKLVAKLGGDTTKRALEFAIPPALASRLIVSIDEVEAEVDFPTAIAFQRTTNVSETRVEAILGAGDRVEMSWMPRMKRIGEMAASIFAQSTTLVTVAGGAVNTRSVIDYQVSQGELRQVKLTLPAGQRLLRVEGEWIRIWELSDEAGAQLLTVDLVKGVAQNYRLTVEMEKVLDKLPTQVRVEVPQVQDVIRENGLVALRGGEELTLGVESAADLQRVDAGEFARNGAFKADGVMSAFRFLKHGFNLTARAEAIQPQVEAVARNLFHVGFEQLTLTTRIDYTIKKAGVFTLRLALPDGYKVESVSGNGIGQWNEKPETRQLEVNLKERTLGSYLLAVTLTKLHKELPKTIDLTGTTPVEVQKLTGFVSITSEAGVAVRTTTFDGLTEIPAAVLGEGKPSGAGSVLAYKFIGTDPTTAGAWKLALATETVESWVRAEVVNLVSVSETLVSGRALVRYDIQNAPAKEFRLRVPTNFTNVEINGADIRRRDQTNDIWRVELQNKVRGSYTLVVTWDETRATKTNRTAADALNFAGVQAIGVERETGSVVLLAKPPLQVTEATAPEPLVRIDVRELPSWAGVGGGANAAGEVPVLVYRYLRPGYALGVEVKRFDEAAVLQALVDNARFTTVVADDGQMMTEMALNIRNNGLQHLRVDLPKDARVWSAFVAGQPVRPSKEGTTLLLPLERSVSDDTPIAVELTYVASQPFPRTKGDVKLESPKLDVPLKNARWDLYLPTDYDYTKFGGSMSYEAAESPVVQIYSSSDYYRQEQEKKVAKKSEMLSFLGNARRSLSEGKLKGANEEFNNAVRLNRDEVDGFAQQEVEQLKRDLSKVQSSNLIQAQRAYTVDNVRRYAGKDVVNAPAEKEMKQLAEQVMYDSEVAEKQWSVLQRAQEVTVAKVQPLRANLPTRGQRHSFSQVLQTEVGKEMTIRFAAANTKHVGWFKQTIYFVGAFLALWILVSLVASRDNRSRPVTA
jgi:prepilin-type processing-associated H-X9-DG protein